MDPSCYIRAVEMCLISYFFGIFVTNTCLRSQNSMYKMCHSVGVIGFHPGEPGFAFPVSLTFV